MTERQRKILGSVVAEHVRSAQPVSSQWLDQTYDFGVSPATIRNDLQELTEEGFLEQPHVSAGRIPTDKGYRFLVDELLQRELDRRVSKLLQADLAKVASDALQFSGFLTRKLALFTSGLVVTHMDRRDMEWKEGWETILAEPEMTQAQTIQSLARLLRDLERSWEAFSPGLSVFIGRETPFSRVQEFSILSVSCRIRKEEPVRVVLIGPKRMAYPRNLAAFQTLVHMFS